MNSIISRSKTSRNIHELIEDIDLGNIHSVYETEETDRIGNKYIFKVSRKGVISCNKNTTGVIIGGILFVNGDIQNEDFSSCIHSYISDGITFSFKCLSRFLNKDGKDNSKRAAEMLANDKIQIIDYNDDDTVYDSKSERPGFGYTWIQENSLNGYWHRPAQILVKDNNRLIILGQDEETYFGSEIKYDPKIRTTENAIKALIPKSIIDIENVKRQGEWFMVPVNEKNVPKIKDCLVIGACSRGSDYFSYMGLPKKDNDSATHMVCSIDIRVDKNGTVFALSPSLYHSKEQHVELDENGWHKFIENTALLSYSEEGVD